MSKQAERWAGSLSARANQTAQAMTGKAEREVVRLPIEKIRRNGGTQPRAGLDQVVVEEYAEVIHTGGKLPPVEVVHDGEHYWLWDGFHRLAAAEQEGETDYECYVSSGTQRDAVLLSVGANAEHGYRRTNEDKRRAVETLLRDPEWSQWSDREIARQCKVSNQFVSNLRKELSVNDGQIGEKNQQKRVVKRGDQVYKQKTRNIGAPNKQRAEEQREKGKTEQANDRMAAKLYELQGVVLAVVEGQPPMTYREIEFAVNAHLGRIANPGLLSGAISQLTQNGLLRNVGGGRYALAEPSDNRYQMEDELSGNSLQIDTGEPEGDWLDRQVSDEWPAVPPLPPLPNRDEDLAAKLSELLRVGNMVAGHLEMVLERPEPIPNWLLIKLNELQGLLYGRAGRDADIYDPGLTQLLDDLYTKHTREKGKGQ